MAIKHKRGSWDRSSKVLALIPPLPGCVILRKLVLLRNIVFSYAPNGEIGSCPAHITHLLYRSNEMMHEEVLLIVTKWCPIVMAFPENCLQQESRCTQVHRESCAVTTVYRKESQLHQMCRRALAGWRAEKNNVFFVPQEQEMYEWISLLIILRL